MSLVPTKSSRKTWFPKVDPEWRAGTYVHQSAGAGNASRPAASITKPERQRGKRMRLDPTAPRLGTSFSVAAGAVDIHDVPSFDALTKTIEAVALPSQIAAVLGEQEVQ